MTTQKQSSLSKLARQIWIYLRQHPMAKDTLEDISGWWLLEQRSARSTSQVEAALAELKQVGLVVVSKRRDGILQYRGAARKGLLKAGESR